jgi:hypothetical protein
VRNLVLAKVLLGLVVLSTQGHVSVRCLSVGRKGGFVEGGLVVVAYEKT